MHSEKRKEDRCGLTGRHSCERGEDGTGAGGCILPTAMVGALPRHRTRPPSPLSCRVLGQDSPVCSTCTGLQ